MRRFPSGTVDQYIYFVAVDSTDLKTRETALLTFTVYRARNGAAAAAYTTPTVAEVSAANMPGVYSLLLDEDMTIAAGNKSEEVVLHITQAAMAPVTLVYELYRPDVTDGETLTVSSGAVTTVTTTTNVTTVNGLAAGVITAAAIAADAITDAKVASDVTIASVTGAVGSVTGAVGSVTGAVGSVTGNVGGSVGSVVGAVGSVTAGVTLAASAVQAIWDAATAALTTVGSIGKRLADNINAAISTANENADALLDRTAGVETGFTVRQVLRLMAAVLAGKASGMGTTTAVFRDLNDTKDRITATVSSDGDRSTINRDVS